MPFFFYIENNDVVTYRYFHTFPSASYSCILELRMRNEIQGRVP